MPWMPVPPLQLFALAQVGDSRMVLCQRPLKLYISVGMQLSSATAPSRPRILGLRIGAILILIWPPITHFCCRSQMQQLLSVAATKDSPSGSKINVWTCKMIENVWSLRMDPRWRTEQPHPLYHFKWWICLVQRFVQQSTVEDHRPNLEAEADSNDAEDLEMAWTYLIVYCLIIYIYIYHCMQSKYTFIVSQHFCMSSQLASFRPSVSKTPVASSWTSAWECEPRAEGPSHSQACTGHQVQGGPWWIQGGCW